MWPHQWILYLSSSFLVGVLFATKLQLLYHPWWPIVILILGGLAVWLRTSRVTKFILIGMIGIALGVARFSISYQDWQSHVAHTALGATTQPIVVTKLISIESTQARLLGRTLQGATYQLDIWNPPPIQVADRLIADLNLRELGLTKYYLANQIVSIGEIENIHSTAAPNSFSLTRILTNLQLRLANLIDQAAPTYTASLLKGLLLGIRTSFDEDFKSYLAHSGTTHIVALSGFNITLVISFLIALLRHQPRPVRLILAGSAVLAFIITTGLSASVVRAAVMGWLLLLSTLWGRQIHLGSALAIAAASMVALHPLILGYDIGFQLSVAATAGLILLAPIIEKLLPQRVMRIPFIPAAVVATIAASLATLPLTTYYFGQLSTVSLIANSLIVPLIPIAMLMGGMGVIFLAVTPWLAPLTTACWLPAQTMIWLIELFGRLQISSIEVTTLSPLLIVTWYAGLVLVIFKYAHLTSFMATSPDRIGTSGRQPLALPDSTSQS